MFSRLKSLSLIGRYQDYNDTARLLQGIRRVLEDVRISDFFSESGSLTVSNWKSLFDVMRVSCPKLTIILTRGRNHPRQEYEDLLISFGHQVRDTMFHSREIQPLCRIPPHCPQLELSVTLKKHSCIPHLTELATQIREINLRYVSHSEANWGEFQIFANRLEKLRSLKCCLDHRSRPLDALFDATKPALEKIIFKLRVSSLNEDVMRKMKSTMANLR